MRDADVSVEVASDPLLLGPVRSLVRTYLEALGIGQDLRDDAVLAVDEACTNSIRHAYGGPCDRSYWITLRSAPDWVEIELRDEGNPAPASKLERKELAPPPGQEHVVPGGLGVQLIYSVFDDVTFCTGEDSGNCVTMRLKRPIALKQTEG